MIYESKSCAYADDQWRLIEHQVRALSNERATGAKDVREEDLQHLRNLVAADHLSAMTYQIDWLEEQPDLSGALIIPWRSQISSDYTRGG
jgi:hypothetical protein